VPASEAQETRNKAQAALAAIRAAQDAVGEREALEKARADKKAREEQRKQTQPEAEAPGRAVASGPTPENEGDA
jgi:hypothetical protein